MFISKIQDEEGGAVEICRTSIEDDSDEYHTANELFDLMARNQNFTAIDSETLPSGDLVLLYKNIDLASKPSQNLPGSSDGLERSKCNQHVETIVYNDPDSEGSDISDVYSNEDLRNLVLVNKERIDLFSPPSFGDTVCGKTGYIDIKTPNDIDKHVLFKDPYLKKQFENLNLLPAYSAGTVLPASLLDYVCCKRLEDNYNFYMDNIIIYVKNTIQQLRRISNGDFLTCKAKEKWMEVKEVKGEAHDNSTKVLATSTSIPMHVECKIGGRRSTWDDLVHSELDVRSLSKILEKKIVVEIPKLIKGSYTLLSKLCSDNLIISCKKEHVVEESKKKESRVDVVFQLKRSETGGVVSNISSIMILQSAPAALLQQGKPLPNVPLPIAFEVEQDDAKVNKTNIHITEVDSISDSDYNSSQYETIDSESIDKEKELVNDNPRRVTFKSSIHKNNPSMIEKSLNTREVNRNCPPQKEASFTLYPDNLRMTINNLTIQSTLTEETTEESMMTSTLSTTVPSKKRSPTRMRIKSPYENKSYALEEKKRRKLLEIREKREKKKMAMAEICKITKHKYGKGTTMPQSSSSVTKLSITNKSFYNSIYGRSTKVDSKLTKNTSKDGVKFSDLETALEELESENPTPKTSPKGSPERNPKKFINRSYYLDDAMTEMMYLKEKEKEKGSVTTLAVSSEFRSNLNLLSQLMAPSDSDLNCRSDDLDEIVFEETKKNQAIEPIVFEKDQETKIIDLKCLKTIPNLNTVPSNSPIKSSKKADSIDKSKLRKENITPVECRKSIDKIYELMKQLEGQPDTSRKSLSNETNEQTNRSPTTTNRTYQQDSKTDLNNFRINHYTNRSPDTSVKTDATTAPMGSISLQGSDSGTSLVHQVESSVMDSDPDKNVTGNATKTSSNVIPKVIISTKSPTAISTITDFDKNKNDRKKSPVPSQKSSDSNPLKAISQLLHEFENVQKNRQKSASEQKNVKKVELATCNEGKPGSGNRQNTIKRRSRYDQQNEVMERIGKQAVPKDRKNRPLPGVDFIKISYNQVPNADKYDKTNKKKITDILDEAKEARGEAVRGPSKFISRLHSLAQPKKAYVQAHNEEYQTRYGRRSDLIADRLQRLAANPAPVTVDRTPGTFNRQKVRQNNYEVRTSLASSKPPVQTGLPIDRQMRPPRQPVSDHFERKEKFPTGGGPTFKPLNVPETSELFKKRAEAYVKKYYGRISSPTFERQLARKSRAPLSSNNIDIMASISSTVKLQESAEIGNKLHRIIDSMVKSSPHSLEVLTECQETTSKSSKENSVDSSPRLNQDDCASTLDTYYTTSTSDGVVTMITHSISTNATEEYNNVNTEEQNCKNSGALTYKSATELETKEKAISPMVQGSFSKKIMINNLTLTPKSSIQKIFVLQSGDTGSLVLKTSISQNLQTDGLLEFDGLSLLSKSPLEKSYSKIPMQITTVGYAFPTYPTTICKTSSLGRLLEAVSMNSFEKSSIKCKDVNNSTTEHTTSLVSTNTDFDYTHLSENNKENVQLKIHLETGTQANITILTSSQEQLGIAVHNSTSYEVVVNDFDNVEFNISSEESGNKTYKKDLEENNTSGSLSDGIDYTTSLDILVGLLNEIKKITTCQTNIANNEINHCSSLEIILNKNDHECSQGDSCLNSNYQEISVSSLDKLHFNDDNNFDILNLSKNQILDRSTNTNLISENLFEATERCYRNLLHGDQNIDSVQKIFVDKTTDIPSLLFPIPTALCHSTSAVHIPVRMIDLCQSSKSLFSIDYSAYSNASSLDVQYMEASSKKIVELPEIESINLIRTVAKTNIETFNEKQECKLDDKFYKMKELSSEVGLHTKTTKIKEPCYLKSSDFDPVMKMKRDILVTFYSMLVFTVFAALSFPEVLYYV